MISSMEEVSIAFWNKVGLSLSNINVLFIMVSKAIPTNKVAYKSHLMNS